MSDERKPFEVRVPIEFQIEDWEARVLEEWRKWMRGRLNRAAREQFEKGSSLFTDHTGSFHEIPQELRCQERLGGTQCTGPREHQGQHRVATEP